MRFLKIWLNNEGRLLRKIARRSVEYGKEVWVKNVPRSVLVSSSGRV